LEFTDLQSFLEQDLPPVDVVMVWHAYLLNPRSVTVFETGLPIVHTVLEAGMQKMSSVFLLCNPLGKQLNSSLLQW
jgi:hypothetical protein